MQVTSLDADSSPPPVPPIPPDEASREQLERIATNRAALWWALALQLLGLLLFVLFCNFVVPSLGQNLGETGRVALGLIVSLVPALLWLGIFYGFDRIEPEPKTMVIVTFVVAALLYAALWQPVLQGIFQVDQWLYKTWWTRLLGGILVIGIFEQYLIFLAVRYISFDHPEFDERVDGVVYAVAAGLGVATAVNFQYVVASGGVDLGIGSLRMVVNALAYASFAGVLGYFIGQARFERTPVWYLPAGLLLAATMNGLLFGALDGNHTSLQTGLPWGDLLVATLVAVAALLLVFYLVARANEETLRIARGEALPAQPREVGRGVGPGVGRGVGRDAGVGAPAFTLPGGFQPVMAATPPPNKGAPPAGSVEATHGTDSIQDQAADDEEFDHE